jgi:hypothetical protein
MSKKLCYFCSVFACFVKLWCYVDKESAILKRGKAEKELYLLYGAQLEGYWSYDDMILQLEDIVDCLKTIYP